MTPSDHARELGKIGAEKRRQHEREIIRAKADLMNKAMGRGSDARLYPPLILTRKDQA